MKLFLPEIVADKDAKPQRSSRVFLIYQRCRPNPDLQDLSRCRLLPQRVRALGLGASDRDSDFCLSSRTYLVSQPLLAYYYTQFIGDAKNLPIILAAPSFDFTGLTVPGGAVFGELFILFLWRPNTHFALDADPYIPGGNGAQWYINQNNL